MRGRAVSARAAGAAGRIRVGLILALALLAVGIYGGGQLAYDHWAYWNLQEEADRAAVEVAAKGVETQGRQMVQAKAQEYGLQLADEEIVIKVQGGVATVAFAWERPIEFPGYTYTLSFQVSATSSVRR